MKYTIFEVSTSWESSRSSKCLCRADQRMYTKQDPITLLLSDLLLICISRDS